MRETNQPQNESAAVAQHKQVKLTRELAKAIEASINHCNALNAKRAQAEAEFTSAAAINQQYIQALVAGGGHKPEEFTQFGVWQEGEDFYLRAKE